ncbi:PfkB family carbohydrate kinase [Maricaulis sp.]|uniref:PfkB family carbohydrate kinase n=1 Tax=Maricaulis sp. TaxID=1486257 RepID=UPI00262D810C|nr:PfkB family carbohydrate kinase [Maricaulis sp.]MDF1767778.1 PfkB family carbohydrate kinase [Maricaulis sp.]
MFSMPMALILSSHVAASMVGGGVSQRVLNSARIDTMLVPTVLFGRHPGWGEPGGGPVEQDQFESVLSGIADQGLLDITDIVLAGYFADVGQIFDTASVIDVVRKGRRMNKGVKAALPAPIIVVDPIMGDSPGGLYVSPAIAAAIKDQLITRADLVTPNLFELGHITGRPLTDLASMVRAARAMERPVLVSSLPRHGQIGVLYVDSEQAWLVTHDRLPKAPNGTGDALTAAFINRLLAGDDARTALEQSVAMTVSLVMRAHEWSAPELPVVAAADVLTSPLVTLEAEAV